MAVANITAYCDTAVKSFTVQALKIIKLIMPVTNYVAQ